MCGGTLPFHDPTASLGMPEVYPRVCGGTAEVRARTPRVVARSIPACAGEPSATAPSFGTCTDGSIPACAGEPIVWPRLAESPGAKVYPRVCGGTALRRLRHAIMR